MNFHNIEFETSCGLPSQLPAETLDEVAVVGRSNVGKSSLLNKVFNRRQLARTSSSPGKTSTINFFRLENIRLADLPGYGYAKVSKAEKQRWQKLIEGYLAGRKSLRLVFQLIDMRHAPTADDLVMIDYWNARGIPFVAVLTKQDKLKKTEREKNLAMLSESIRGSRNGELIPFSAETGEGAERIREILDEIASGRDDA